MHGAHGATGQGLECPQPPRRTDESLPVPHIHPEGSARRSGSRQPAAHAARRHDQEARRRHLHVDAARPARAAQGRGHRPRGDESRRRDRAPDAGGPAGRAVAGDRPLGEVRARAAAPQGPARARLHRPADARGSGHRHRAQGDPQLQAAAAEPVPHPDQVPRRGPAALRRDARARVHHEGRVLVRRRRGRC